VTWLGDLRRSSDVVLWPVGYREIFTVGSTISIAALCAVPGGLDVPFSIGSAGVV
jgi:hypothetical protein